MQSNIIKLGIYRHYKDNLYEVIGECMLENIKLVLYYGKGNYWLRPKDMFLDCVEPNKPRFTYVGEPSQDEHNPIVAMHTEEEIYYGIDNSKNCYKL